MSDLILLALDGSTPSQLAAGAAIQIAAERNLLVLGLYVVDEAFISDPRSDIHTELGTTEVPGTKAELISRFVLQGDRALKWLEKGCRESDVIASTNVLFGGITETILKEADRAMLIGLGRRGHGHAADTAHLGLNFLSIAMHTQKPLLVGGDDLRPIKRVLVAYRGGSQSQETLDWASRFYHMLNTELIILVVAEDRSTRPDEPAQFDQRGLTGYHIIRRSGQPAAEIVSTAEETQADLIIMGRYRQSTLMEWLTGSVPDQVLRQTKLPVLIV
jgi:nucleotide-binding universal stress UspA family protein